MVDKSAAKSARITPIAKAAGGRLATKIRRMALFPRKFRMVECEVDVSLTDLRYTRPTRGTPTIRTRERSETLLASGESGKSSGFGLEGGDSLDEARDSEGIAHAASAADEAQSAAFVDQLFRNAN